MLNDLITHLQIFGIGLSFAVAGPCLLICSPILITYMAARQDNWARSLIDLFVFLSGRLFAYVLLGYIAGLSGLYLRRFSESYLVRYFNLAGGIISILLGLSVLMHKYTGPCADDRARNNIHGSGGILALGFVVGISPCAPLAALLFEIALISKSALSGASYALSFGLGTLVAGFIVIGSLAGILKGFVRKMVSSKAAGDIFRVSCAILLILFGLGLIYGKIKA